MKPLSAQAIEFFKDDVENIVRQMGAKDAPENLSQFQLDTRYGILWISVREGWIACCFEEPNRAKEANLGERLNHYSGKWNWHEGPDGLDSFTRAVYKLLDHNDDQAIICVQKVMQKLSYDLTFDQAKELWSACRDKMCERGLTRSVIEIEQSENGELDTLIRGDLHDAVAQEMADMHWPCNGDSDETNRLFIQRVDRKAREKGYA